MGAHWEQEKKQITLLNTILEGTKFSVLPGFLLCTLAWPRGMLSEEEIKLPKIQ
jgi:hypothetical protein